MPPLRGAGDQLRCKGRMSTSAIEPIFPVPAHVECPAGPLRAWFSEPKGAVVQLSEAGAVTEEMARWLIGPGRDLLLERFAASTGFWLVLDIRPMTSREPIVRSLMMDSAREHMDTFSNLIIVPPLQINPVYLTTLQAAAALLGAFGTHVEITKDLKHVLGRDQIRPVAPG
jgi:hypothetical protein